MCDMLNAAPEEQGDAQHSWYYDKNAQCSRCPPNAKLEVSLLFFLLVLAIPIFFCAGQLLTDPDLVHISSPAISVIVLLQIASQFDASVAGGVWPPMMQAVFNAMDPLLQLSIHSFKTECAFGFSLLPTTVLGSIGIEGWNNAFAALGALLLLCLLQEYGAWLVYSAKRRRLLRPPWALPAHARAPMGNVPRMFGACCCQLVLWMCAKHESCAQLLSVCGCCVAEQDPACDRGQLKKWITPNMGINYPKLGTLLQSSEQGAVWFFLLTPFTLYFLHMYALVREPIEPCTPVQLLCFPISCYRTIVPMILTHLHGDSSVAPRVLAYSMYTGSVERLQFPGQWRCSRRLLHL